MKVPKVSGSASIDAQAANGLSSRSHKSLWLAYPLHLFGAGGGLALHRFYLGYYRSGALMLALFIVHMSLAGSSTGRIEIFGTWLFVYTHFAIFGWAILDLFLIPRMRREANRLIEADTDQAVKQRISDGR